MRKKELKEKLAVIDKSSLSADEKDRIKRFLAGDVRALHQRDKALGLRFRGMDIKRWKAAAERAGKAFSDWAEEALDALEARTK